MRRSVHGSSIIGVTKTKRQDLCLSFCFVIPMCRANPLVRPSIDVQSLTGEDIVAQAEMLPVGVTKKFLKGWTFLGNWWYTRFVKRFLYKKR